MKNTAVCLSPKQMFDSNCILLRAHFTEGHQNNCIYSPTFQSCIQSHFPSNTHLSRKNTYRAQRARKALIQHVRVLGWSKRGDFVTLAVHCIQTCDSKPPSTKTKASSIHFICLHTTYKGATYGLICLLLDQLTLLCTCFGCLSCWQYLCFFAVLLYISYFT